MPFYQTSKSQLMPPLPRPGPAAIIHQETINQLAEIRGLLNQQEVHQLAVGAAEAERQIAHFETFQLQSLLRATQRRYQLQQAPRGARPSPTTLFSMAEYPRTY